MLSPIDHRLLSQMGEVVAEVLVCLDRLLSGIVRWIIITMMAVMTGVVFSQVLARYIFNSSLSWSEEVARFAFVCLSFMGAAMLVRRDEHIRVTMLVDTLSTRVWWVMRALQYAGVLICLYFFVVGGVSLTEAEWYQLAPATQIRMGWIYLVIPVASTLMLLWTLTAIAIDLTRGRPQPPTLEDVAASDVSMTQ